MVIRHHSKPSYNITLTLKDILNSLIIKKITPNKPNLYPSQYPNHHNIYTNQYPNHNHNIYHSQYHNQHYNQYPNIYQLTFLLTFLLTLLILSITLSSFNLPLLNYLLLITSFILYQLFISYICFLFNNNNFLFCLYINLLGFIYFPVYIYLSFFLVLRPVIFILFSVSSSWFVSECIDTVKCLNVVCVGIYLYFVGFLM